MKVDITRSQKTRGMVFKETDYFVIVQVQFTEEEKKIIELKQAGRNLLVERPYPPEEKVSLPGKWHLYINNLILGNPDVHPFDHPQKADDYMMAVVPALQEFKKYLEFAKTIPESISVEI